MDHEPVNSSSGAWGETENGGGWDNPPSSWDQSSTIGWTGSTSEPLPVPPPLPTDAQSPLPTSPPPPRSPSVMFNTPTTIKDFDSQKPMLEEPHDEYHTWGSHHDATPSHGQWESPLGNATTQILLTSPTAEQHPLPSESQSFTAAAAAMRNVRYTSASEIAKKNTRTLAPPKPHPQPVPVPPVPRAPVASTPNAQRHPHMSSQQWAACAGGALASTSSVNQFGNRDGYTAVAAALNRNIKKAAAAGHYNSGALESEHSADWATQARRPGDWDDPLNGSGWSQQPQPSGAEACCAHKGSDTGWDSRSKRRSGDQ